MSDLEVIQSVYAAFVAHDLEALLALSDREILITQDEVLPWGGRFLGHDGVTTFAFALIGATDSVLRTDTMFEADGQVIQIGRTQKAPLAPMEGNSMCPRSISGQCETAK